MNLAFKEYGASPIWNAVTVRMFSPSEHTIGGTRYDMELSLEMNRKVNIGAYNKAYSSFMFSVSSYTAIFCDKNCIQAIDNFFDDL